MTLAPLLTPVVLNVGGLNPTDLTTALSGNPFTGSSYSGILFQNTGRDVVVVQTNSTGSTTVTSDIGTTVQGQTVPGVESAAAQPASTIQIYGPYPSQYDRQDGTNEIEIDFGTPANVEAVVQIRIPGVF